MPPTTRTPSATDRQEKRQLYRKLMVGVVVGAVVVALGLRQFGFPLVGEGVYWLGILSFFAIWRGTSMQLFDERDAALERRASHATLLLVGAVLVLGASAARTVTYLGWYEVPTIVSGVLYGYVGLFVAWAAVYLWFRFGR